MPRATARHILVDSEEDCESIKRKIQEGARFADMARQFSRCPSAEHGGELGEFGAGETVPEFDKLVFEAKIGEIYGPIHTKFGYHLVEITTRTP
jgi:peptidyl-prolyl cis-trans isomerase C